MNKKIITIKLSILGLFLISSNLIGQEIKGNIIDSKSNLPLAFVNIGVIDIPRGTISDENGVFNLNCKKIPQDSKIRISMIGYESQTFALNDLIKESNTIKLIEKAVELDEVVVRWKEIIRKTGTTKITNNRKICGWGGTGFGQGHEIGLLIDLGSETVKIENLNLKVNKQSFDTITFRIHIRSIENGLPSTELLARNIYFNITEYSGWQKIDLSDYNIFEKGQVALTIEWIKYSNIINKNLVKVNGNKADPNVLFNMNHKSGTLYSRKGSESKWYVSENSSPAFFLTIKE